MANFGITPAPPVVANALELLVDLMAQSSLMQDLQTIAPLLPIQAGEGRSGRFPIRSGWRGLDLQRDPGALTAAAAAAKVYPTIGTEYGSVPYDIRRYLVGTSDIVYPEVSELRTVGIDDFEQLAADFEAKATGMLYNLVMGAVGNTALYASGHHYDPGNLTTAATNYALLVEGVERRFRDANIDVRNADIVMIVARDVMPYLRNLDQIRAAAVLNSPTAQYQTNDGVLAFTQEILRARSLKLVVDDGRFVNTSGAKASVLSANVAFHVVTSSRQRSKLRIAVKPLQLAGAKAQTPALDMLRGMFSLRPEPDAALNGETWYCDGWWDVMNVDPTAGVLWTTVLT